MKHICPTCHHPIEPSLVMLDTNRNVVVAGGAYVKLQRREMELLSILYQRSPRSVHRECLMAAMYPDSEVWDSVLNVLVCQIRRKLTGMPLKIESWWGEGWRLVET